MTQLSDTDFNDLMLYYFKHKHERQGDVLKDIKKMEKGT